MTRRRSVWSTRRYVRCHACGRIVLERWARPTIADGTITAWTCRHCQPTRPEEPRPR